MTTLISKNLSYRRLIKQKTNELLDYHRCVPKTTKNLGLRPKDVNNSMVRRKSVKQNDTSINLDNSLDTSLSKRLSSKMSSKDKKKRLKVPSTGEQIKSSYLYYRRPNISRFKSVEALPKKKSNSRELKTSFSVKKLIKNERIVSQPKLTSMENLEIVETQRKVTQMEYAIPKSQTDLKQGLKKSSTSKLKLKVKDPFQKRVRLDIAFEDESFIGKRQDSMISTVNQEEFRELLAKIM